MTTLHNGATTADDLDTRALVRRAAEQLTAEGSRVTVRGVRALVGRGSTTTIAEELRDWRSSDLAKRASSPVEQGSAGTVSLPPALAQEAQVLYLRVLAQVGVELSSQRAAQAMASAEACAAQQATLNHVARLTDFGTDLTRQLMSSVEEQARLGALLIERDAMVERLTAKVAELTAEVGRLTQEVAASKLAAAEREALALSRAEGLSKHLMRMTEEQRSQIAAPLAQLKERYEALQLRDGVMTQQLNALRAENSRLKGEGG